MSIERLRALEKKWRAAGDAETKRADGDGLSDGEQGWHHGRGEQYDNCADELATLIAELGQEVGAVADALTLSAPPKVWLQVDTAADDEDEREPIPRDCWEHMSWCHESIGGHEVVYVREDLASPAHTSEARGVLWTGWYHPDPEEQDDFMLYDAKDHRCDDCIRVHVIRAEDDAAMRQEGGTP